MAYIKVKEGWETRKSEWKFEADRNGNVTSWTTQYCCSSCEVRLSGTEKFCPQCGVTLDDVVKEGSDGPFPNRINYE